MIAVAGCTHTAPAVSEVVLTSASSEDDPDTLPRTIKVVTFNVHRRNGDSIARAFAHDPVLRDADVIVLEEVRADADCSSACVAAHKLGLYAAYEPDWQLDGWSLGQAILSRAPLENTRVIELPKYLERNAALVTTVRIGGEPVTIYAVHLTVQLDVAERATQMLPILEDARARAAPAIIAGDFNAAASFVANAIPVPKPGAALKFEALVRRYGFATPMAHSGSTFRVLPMKLDGIFTRGFDTHAFGTARGRDISDHLALWAVMTLRRVRDATHVRATASRAL